MKRFSTLRLSTQWKFTKSAVSLLHAERAATRGLHSLSFRGFPSSSYGSCRSSSATLPLSPKTLTSGSWSGTSLQSLSALAPRIPSRGFGFTDFYTWLEGSWAIQSTKSVLIQMHEMGLPWWSILIVLPAAGQIVDYPLHRMALANQRKLNSFELRKLHELVPQAKDPNIKKKLIDSIRFYSAQTGFRWWKNWIPLLVNIPISIYFGITVRSLCATEPSLSTGGLLWFIDLAARDPYFRLPFLLFGAQMMQFLATGSDPRRLPFIIVLFRQIYPFLMIPMFVIFTLLPQGVSYFWLIRVLFLLGRTGWVKYLAKKERERSEAKPEVVDSPISLILDDNFRWRRIIRAGIKY